MKKESYFEDFYYKKHGLLYIVYERYQTGHGDMSETKDSEWNNEEKAKAHCEILNKEYYDSIFTVNHIDKTKGKNNKGFPVKILGWEKNFSIIDNTFGINLNEGDVLLRGYLTDKLYVISKEEYKKIKP